MLFSNEAVAEFINKNFESAWTSVHPVPVVTIDFGDGHLIKRRIGGNVATYVCTSEGKVLDILPGVYRPDVYTDRLRQFTLLNKWVQQAGRGAEGVARDYHRRQAGLIAGQGKRANIVARRMPSMSILATEGGLRFFLAQPGDAKNELLERMRRRERIVRLVPLPNIDSAEALEQWPVMAEETKHNETVRRKLIHEHLAEKGLVQPNDITNWLFRKVLDTDLDDPYLGMGNLLSDSQSGSENRSSGDAQIDSEPVAAENDPPAPPSDK